MYLYLDSCSFYITLMNSMVQLNMIHITHILWAEWVTLTEFLLSIFSATKASKSAADITTSVFTKVTSQFGICHFSSNVSCIFDEAEKLYFLNKVIIIKISNHINFIWRYLESKVLVDTITKRPKKMATFSILKLCTCGIAEMKLDTDPCFCYS